MLTRWRVVAMGSFADGPLLIPISGKLPVRLWALPMKMRTSDLGSFAADLFSVGFLG